jgi:hypothetical protein
MPHKFKIGDIVNYNASRAQAAASGAYTVTGLMPALDGQPPEYRIRHHSEDFERVAIENELSVA